jgi:DsbC/DsbD-like thiol-disulfide interchange protein
MSFFRAVPCASIMAPTSALVCALAFPVGAQAASSGWHHVEGGAIRIVTSGEPDAGGHLRGALEIRLKPGWKTYWLDPGASGVPPTLTASADKGDTGDTGVAIGFPPPRRFDDGYAPWVGYDHPVSLALTIALPQQAQTPARLEASVFLGVCETICIPVQATLSFDPRDGTHAAEDVAVVEDAFAALPAPARAGFSASIAEAGDEWIVVDTALPADARLVDLFVAGTETLALGTPERQPEEGGNRFRVPVASRSGKDAESVAYTLVTDLGAVSGTMELPPR